MIINSTPDFPLHRVGWLAFQDLCAAVAEEVLKRPVQTFLPTNDAGRDGAFIGKWDDPKYGGMSTIQCKYTAKEELNLSLSMLSDELAKAEKLAQNGLAKDYIILTNHTITGVSEIAIKKAFENVGVEVCRVFHRDWIVQQIKSSARLRMLVPRLYGLGNFRDIFDQRAYDQTQMILSEMSDNLEKLVVTKAYKDSVKAISEHNVVLLLGSPAAGKSTIAASLALGSVDMWNCSTIKATSPSHLREHIDAIGKQFFWIDDAWGSTQYQGNSIEEWNQVFPLMQASIQRGTKYLITSRDYIWERAKRDLKLNALPALTKNQVIIQVQDLREDEKARILYNHLKFGTQNKEFVSSVKPFLPKIAALSEFLPESARRLSNPFFTGNFVLPEYQLKDFFKKPKGFLEDTLLNLDPSCLAAIALIFLNGGKVSSPVSYDLLNSISVTFGVEVITVRNALEALRDSLLLYAFDEKGAYWTYKHPTISDAFASNVAKSPELVEIYLRGAKPESLIVEVICIGRTVTGAPVVVPDNLHDLLVKRVAHLDVRTLRSFIVNRANESFTKSLLALRPDIIPDKWEFIPPMGNDGYVAFFARLYELQMITEDERLSFLSDLKDSIASHLDDSFLDDRSVKILVKEHEIEGLLDIGANSLENFDKLVEQEKTSWFDEYDPSDHFDGLKWRIETFAEALESRELIMELKDRAVNAIDDAINDLQRQYTPPESEEVSTPHSLTKADSLTEIFRDIDE
ncbi:MAG: hypothetical protein EOO20_02820 [Chryseobacterium sp.]|nr:MAG: hypothetical protein EOO20_02820 [Chryseobacterium sp.]